jgi:hypothetical protein
VIFNTDRATPMSQTVRKFLCASALIAAVRKRFSKISDPRKLSEKNKNIPLIDHLMSGLAIFGLKFPSLLGYDRKRKDPPTKKNLRTLYQVESPPSDTYLRERLDKIDPILLRPAFTKLFSYLQRGKCLEQFEFMEGHYLLSLDGTGEFSSGKICCEQCCQKKHQNGTVTYYHQMLGACIVHPDKPNVIPLCPENIQNRDGHKKNDCERNAAKRFLENFRREHPHLKVIMVEDGLASNAPHIQDLETYGMKFILGAKPGDHGFLFKQAEESNQTEYYEFKDEKGFFHQFSFINGISLNKSNLNVKVNFFEYRETNSKGKETGFSWVTNIHITRSNIYQLMRGGRARWKIENETYNTLKNLGYNFEHNYGHGKQYLSTVFCLLMMLAFLIDQIQEIACNLYRTAKKTAGTYRDLWQSMRTLFEYVEVASWELLYQIIAKKVTIILDST